MRVFIALICLTSVSALGLYQCTIGKTHIYADTNLQYTLCAHHHSMVAEVADSVAVRLIDRINTLRRINTITFQTIATMFMMIITLLCMGLDVISKRNAMKTCLFALTYFMFCFVTGKWYEL
jgi:hypothetical protein